MDGAYRLTLKLQDSDMNEETLTFVLSIAGFLLVAFLGLTGFFLNRFVKQNDSMAVDINEIKLIIERSSLSMQNMQQGCHEKHDNINKKIDDHESRLNKHDKDIYKLKQHINDDMA